MLPLLWIDPALSAMTGGPINRLASIFGRVFAEDTSIGAAMAGVPMAMWEDDEHIYVEAGLPGLTDQDADILVQGGRLWIRGERKPEEGRTYLYDGRCYGRFERAITLPAAVATAAARAELKGGILSRTLPKSPESKPRTIAFKARSRRVERALAKVAAALVTMALVLLAAVGTAS
jgi:HSP20 family molecular chaperone IbpA